MTQNWSDQSSTVNVNELTEQLRIQAQPAQAFAQSVSGPDGRALGKGTGDTVQYLYFPDLDTSGGQLSELVEVPSTGLTPVKVTYSVAEYGNSVIYTESLEHLARYGAKDVYVQALYNDWQKLQNSQARAQYALTDWVYVPDSTTTEFVTNGTPTVVADQDLSIANLKEMVKYAIANNIPFYDGEDYLGIFGVDTVHNLQTDSDFTDYLRYDSGRAVLNGELGRIANTRVCRDNHAIADNAEGSFKEGFLTGADGVAHDVSMPQEMRLEVKDLGRQIKLGYLFRGAWYKVLDQTSHSQENIIRIDSATS